MEENRQRLPGMFRREKVLDMSTLGGGSRADLGEACSAILRSWAT